ncbi:hypothetical protein SOVF_127520 isoform A [Spinacia oleracea]|nr:hypothetical protein SOVF_127520 isoform A [Spinacia oleracea]
MEVDKEKARQARLSRRYIIMQRDNKTRVAIALQENNDHNQQTPMSIVNRGSSQSHAYCRKRRANNAESSSSSRRRQRSTTVTSECSIQRTAVYLNTTTDVTAMESINSSNISQSTSPTLQHQRKYNTTWNFGGPKERCSHCSARVWIEERVKSVGSVDNPKFSICCQRGKVQVPKLK